MARSDEHDGSHHPAIGLAWAAFGVQAVAVGFHQAWHLVGFAEPPSDAGHYLLLHFPLHLGVVLLGASAVWMAARTTAPLPLPLVLLAAGALVQHGGIVADVLAVFGDAHHTPGAGLLAGGGLLALTAPAARRVQAPR